MSKHEDNESKLLADAFHDDWQNGPTAGFARRAAARARRQSRVRNALPVAAACAVAVAIGFIVKREHPAPSLPDQRGVQQKISGRGYEIISDEELLTQLRDRPLLVVRKENGAREFVLLPNE
jgi:hypothetical protein